MISTKTWTIKDIESMTEAEAFTYAGEKLEIKGHQVYILDFGGYFGVSALVFCNGHHIKYANDYELHHQGKNFKELRALYIESLNNKLFTEEELAAPLKDYDEYSRKSYFLHNYYGMRESYVSMFRILHNEEEEKAMEAEVAGLIFNPICFGYYRSAEFVDRCKELAEALEKAKAATVNNYEYQKAAFLREMFNHEYGINWQADYDVLSAFGRIHWAGDCAPVHRYFDELGFNEIQRRAYAAAQAEYYKRAEF